MLEMALAFNYGQKDGSGNKPTQWVEASLWGKRAESLKDYLKKGAAVDVILSTRTSRPGRRKTRRQASSWSARCWSWNSPAVVATHRRVAGETTNRLAFMAAAICRPASSSNFDDLTDDVPF